ncbi:hypothetical protein TNCV_1090811 [Trichonephila clavipes]|uniref:Uncharacterized protein n=1 Tax=Trichonephila clavipes TaxID=2585209 RepID=A0A8X6SXI5_TRICX|nr:hypothetical protein TNCV_1090811 [Trichonephila clavipes]
MKTFVIGAERRQARKKNNKNNRSWWCRSGQRERLVESLSETGFDPLFFPNYKKSCLTAPSKVLPFVLHLRVDYASIWGCDRCSLNLKRLPVGVMWKLGEGGASSGVVLVT